MSNRERALYNRKWEYLLNTVLLPFKLVVPQPLICRLPLLTSNKDIRIGLVLNEVNGRLLDIGCGENELVALYRQRSGEGIGVDVYPWSGVDMIVKDTADLPFEDKSFDTVTLVACINHIPNRARVLKEVRRILSDQGKLVLTNLPPAISCVWHAVAFWDKDQHQRGMAEGEEWGLSTQTLESLLTDNGFQVLVMERFSWRLNQLYVCAKE